ncbi:MAG: 6-carboxytetrahydropterin synthase [Bdellovibrio sp.]
MIFADGTRETLHGHNYRVMVEAENNELQNDMVFDFLDIKPLIREICDEWDHHLILPSEHPQLKINFQNQQCILTMPDGGEMSFPPQDVLCLPIVNTSVERLALFFGNELKLRMFKKFNFSFKRMKITIEETPGQCASVWVE